MAYQTVPTCILARYQSILACRLSDIYMGDVCEKSFTKVEAAFRHG